MLVRLREAKLALQPEKCDFLRKEVEYLGHVVGETEIKADLKKLSAINDFPVPKNQKSVEGFLGIIGYYRKFIANYATMAQPLYTLLKKDEIFKWEYEQKQSFRRLKKTLCRNPILQLPDF